MSTKRLQKKKLTMQDKKKKAAEKKIPLLPAT